MDDVPAQLIVKRGPEPNQKFTLNQPEVTIGRSKKNAVILTDPEVSRKHARIERDGDIYLIEDLGSTNGTFVNGQRIKVSTALYNGDEIRLGDAIVLQFWHMAVDPENESELSAHSDETIFDSMSLEVGGYDNHQDVGTATSLSAEDLDEDDFYLAPEESSRSRRWLWSCGCALFVLIFICGASIYFLDAYDNGRLLYCGPLQPLFQILLGPFGFAPACF